MEVLILILELVVLLGAIAMGRGRGVWGWGCGAGWVLLVLVFGFGEVPGTIPGDVLLIILSVIMAASAMEAAGGIDFLVRIAAGLIRKSPRHVTIIAPVVSYIFTFLAGTGHIFYPLLPVIYEVAMKGRVRPERPIAVATIASQQAITASPVSAATAALITVLGSKGIGLAQILMICVPSTLLGVIVAALVQTRIGKDLDQDPEYLRRVAAGELKEAPAGAADELKPLPPRANVSAYMFLMGVGLVVLCGLFPSLRTVTAKPPVAVTAPATTTAATVTSNVVATTTGAASTAVATTAAVTAPAPAAAPTTVVIGMDRTIAIIMLALAAGMLLVTRAPVAQIVKTKTCQAGITASIGILGLAWLGDTFMDANESLITRSLKDMATAYPATFSIGLFATSMLLFSQAATTKALMPLGLTLEIAPGALAGMFPAVNGYFFIPTYGTLIAAVNFDRSGTTRIGRYVLNHSFMIPGLISTAVAVGTGLLIGKLFF